MKISMFKMVVLTTLFFSTHEFQLKAQTMYAQEGITLNKDSLLNIIRKFNFERFYTQENFPTKFLDKAAKWYAVPEDETMLGFIDASIQGNSKYGCVIGLKGFYVYNSDKSASPGPKFIPYIKLKLNDVAVQDKFDYRIDFSNIEVFGLSKESKQKVGELLRLIKSRLLK
jgi:hypothetical protein